MIDVCLLLEGTYPYVAGGVSTWVHQLLTAMSDIRFGIIYIAPHSDPTRKIKYDVPSNVIYLKEIYLHDYNLSSQRIRKPKMADYQTLKSFYENLFLDKYDSFKDFASLFRGPNCCFDLPSFFDSPDIWKVLTEFYEQANDDISFIDYFWTWRGTHLPLLQILTATIPPAKIYHAVSTGYAGLIGSLAKLDHDCQFYLTEHGIYTHERHLEISQANWIYERERSNYRATKDLSFFKNWWIQMFRHMSHLTYLGADKIFTLYEGNKVKQILEGATNDKISIIPNGISLNAFDNLEREPKPQLQIGLIGRVVPIKDIKTFIQSAKIVVQDFPDAQFYILGPTDEEQEYYEECVDLVNNLQLAENVQFTGRVDIKDYLSFLDVVVLTSISEAQPYVILEANLAGIPVVATDVGACREMLEGRSIEDKHIGPSGIVTAVSSPQQTAQAIIDIAQDNDKSSKMIQSGMRRVKTYYDQDDLLSRYLNIYEKGIY